MSPTPDTRHPHTIHDREPMTAELDALVALQDLDTVTDQARHRLAHLPERRKADELVAGEQAAATELTRLGAQRDVLAKRQDAVEREIATCRAKQAELTKRLGVTSVPRVAETLQHELATSKARESSLEDDELAVLEELEPVEAAIASTEQRRDLFAAEHVGAADALAVAERDTAAEIARLLGTRAGVAASVPAPLLERYGQLRPRLAGVAVARLVGGHCSGCNLTMSTSELQRLRSLPPGELDECESCGRLLIP